ncbi:threonine-phosphate decarboxylase CobD [Thalassospira sp. TSL5-1]|uniref:threonine-phosphate decarboxylase CobD n=1 Tax=Thalassospira sp. TSL5-1 TaxID=1544451 RepID=UPI00093A4565|nr:threonine-phosphate decarboxylase CobD [Thalassospira sp. TSL5-1]
MKDDIFHHGGAIDLAAQRYGIPLDQWLDLSTGINPLPYRVGDIPLQYWHRLPLAHDLARLIKAAEEYYNVPVPGHLVCAPGTQALIQLLPFVLAQKSPIKKVAVLGPTYGEHAPAWKRAGVDTTEIQTTATDRRHILSHKFGAPPSCTLSANLHATGWRGKQDDIDFSRLVAEHDVFVIVNPNNPDGGVIDATTLGDFARYLGAHGKYLIIDEAFADTSPETSLCRQIDGLENTVILRSFGKFFGLAGVRVGFALATPDIVTQLSDRLGPWSVPGPALHIATQALTDKTWHQHTRKTLHQQAGWLDEQIINATGSKCIGGTNLMRLYEGENLPALQDHLAKQGIWVRGFASAPTWLRLGLPGTPANMDRLSAALSGFGKQAAS